MNIITVIVRNEWNYILEFVEYHLNTIKFDKIIIFNNDVDDNGIYKNILIDYINKGSVEIIDIINEKSPQINTYNYVLDNFNFDWCAFIDCDEFITFNNLNSNKIKTITDFLNGFNEDAETIVLNWMCFGDNDLIYPTSDSVLNTFKIPKEINFRYSYNFPENMHVKSIVKHGCKGRFVTNPHIVDKSITYNANKVKLINNSPFQYITYNVAYIRHFFTKSLSEYYKYKMNRGNVCNSLATDSYSLKKYFKYNKITDEKVEYLSSVMGKDKNEILKIIK